MVITSFLVAIATFAVAEATSVLAPRGLVKRVSGPPAPGAPGVMCYADNYNTIPGYNWNHTYTATEPQQVHISLTDDAKTARVQFATLGQIEQSVLDYWPKQSGNKNKNKFTTITGQDWTFVDGGVAQRPLYLHKFETNALRPATVYSYQVGVKNSTAIEWSKTFEFHTPSRRNDFSFLATGDVGACNAVSVKHLMDLAKTHKYDFITLAGDQAYNMEDFNGTKGDEYLNFMQDLYAYTPYLGAVGNHEAAYNFTHYKNRFNIVPYAESKFDNSMFYSFNYKSLHLVSFSTEIYSSGTPAEAQTALNWLEADLTEANKNRDKRPWIILLTHHPIYCSLPNSDCTTKAATIRNGPIGANNQTSGGIEDILLKYNVDIYMSGHVHAYERTLPMAHGNYTATNYHNAPSFFQLLTGDAGQPSGGDVWDNSTVIPKWSVAHHSGYGYTTVRVSPSALNIAHYAANTDGTAGGIVDQFSVTKDAHQHKKW